MKDIFTWSVTCDDGKMIHEYDEARLDGRGWAEIGNKLVTSITITSQETGQSHHVAVPNSSQPVFFRRRSVAFHPISGQEESRSTVHCIGWKAEERAVYLFVSENGETLLTNELQAV